MGKRVRYRRRKFRYSGVLFLLLLLCAAGMIGYGIYRLTAGSAADAENPERTAQEQNADTQEQEMETEPRNDGVMPEADPDADSGNQTDDPPAPPQNTGDASPYSFGTPVPESGSVEDSWFEDAVFLGDSRTEGLQLYSGITTGTFFWEWGMSVFKVDDTGHRKVVVNGEKMTLMEALSTGTWSKVYIMLGINDLGYQAQSYQKALGEVVDQVREIQGDAVIYLQTMPPVNESLAEANGIAYYINNENVKAFNEAIAQVAADKQVVLLDTASCLTDSQGQLPADMSSDGVHFKKAGYETWLTYLKGHTLSLEDYQAARQAAQTRQGGAENNR